MVDAFKRNPPYGARMNMVEKSLNVLHIILPP